MKGLKPLDGIQKYTVVAVTEDGVRMNKKYMSFLTKKDMLSWVKTNKSIYTKILKYKINYQAVK